MNRQPAIEIESLTEVDGGKHGRSVTAVDRMSLSDEERLSNAG
jgi:hypothetical protein